MVDVDDGVGRRPSSYTATDTEPERGGVRGHLNTEFCPSKTTQRDGMETGADYLVASSPPDVILIISAAERQRTLVYTSRRYTHTHLPAVETLRERETKL